MEEERVGGEIETLANESVTLTTGRGPRAATARRASMTRNRRERSGAGETTTENQDVQRQGKGGQQRRNKNGDMMDDSRRTNGAKPGKQRKEGWGQRRTTDRIKEIRSIKGGARRKTRWVTVNMGGGDKTVLRYGE